MPQDSGSSFKMAGAYRLSDRIIIHSNMIYRSGLAILSAPVFTAMTQDDPSDIGNMILLALDSAVVGVPDPDRYQVNLDPLLRAAGLRSERKLQQQTLYCTIEIGPDSYILSPTHNGGTRGDSKGFQFLAGQAIRVERSSSKGELGSSLLEAFNKCTSVYDAP
jgi:hypothetical protein